MGFRIATLACALALLVAGPAAAQRDQIAPPGNSGVDEYLETVPTAEGNRPSRSAAERRERGGGGALSREARRGLEAQGPDGRRAAALAEATAPRRPSREGAGASGLADAGDGQGAVGSVLERVAGADDGGMGAALPILLVLTLAGGIAGLLLRRRRGVA